MLMRLIKKSKHLNVYANVGMVNKYIYMKRSDNNYDLYFIYKIDEILETSPVKYKADKCYLFAVPKNKNCQAFCYDNTSKVELLSTDELYEMTAKEWLATFRVFVENEGVKTKDLPSKLIQD